jgi:hypothetical protein
MATMVATSVDSVIAALGGTHKTAAFFGVSPQAVSNWRRRGFPWHAYPFIDAKLRPYDIELDLRLFVKQRLEQETATATAADSQEVDAEATRG